MLMSLRLPMDHRWCWLLIHNLGMFKTPLDWCVRILIVLLSDYSYMCICTLLISLPCCFLECKWPAMDGCDGSFQDTSLLGCTEIHEFCKFSSVNLHTTIGSMSNVGHMYLTRYLMSWFFEVL